MQLRNVDPRILWLSNCEMLSRAAGLSQVLASNSSAAAAAAP